MWLLLGCAHLVPATGLPFAEAPPAVLAEGAVVLGGTAFDAEHHAQGESVALTWQPKADVSAFGGAPRWRYALLEPDRAWTWESPEGAARTGIRLASGATVDVLVEDGTEAGFHWTAIDRPARAVVANGYELGGRVGEIVATGDTFVLTTNRGIERFDPRARTWTLLLPVAHAALVAATDGHAWWVTDTGLSHGRMEDLVIRDPRPVAGQDMPELAPPARVRVVLDGEGWSVVYAGGTGDDAGIHRQRLDESLAPIGAPTRLMGATSTWDLLVHEGVPVLAVAEEGPASKGPPWAAALPAAPGWVRVEHPTTTTLALTAGAAEPLLWGQARGAQLWRLPVRGVDEALRPDPDAPARAFATIRALLALPRLEPEAVGRATTSDEPNPVIRQVVAGAYKPDPKLPVESAIVTLRMGSRCVTATDVQAAFGAGVVDESAESEPRLSHAFVSERVGSLPAESRRVVWTFGADDGCLSRVLVIHRVPTR